MNALSLPFDLGKILMAPQWPGLPPAAQATVFALLAVVPLGLMLWLYRYELKIVPHGTAALLLTLRLVVLALIWFLVCLKPVYAHDHTDGLPGRVLVVVDRSDSMDVADPQRQASDKLRLARALKLADGLATDAQLDQWIRAYDGKHEPQLVAPEEARDDPARRKQLQKERREALAKLGERVDRITRTEAARRVLAAEGVGLLPLLAGKHEVELLGFARETQEFKPDQIAELFQRPPAAPRKEGEKAASRGENLGAFTDLRLPLVRSLERSGPGRAKVLGVVLLTDGQHNWGEAPNKKARELGQRGLPIYPIALGGRKPPPDVAVLSIKAPPAVFKDVEVAVEVRFKVTGLEPQDVRVELHRDGKEKTLLAERTIRHEGKDRVYTESFPVQMDVAGHQRLVATVRPVNPKTRETYAANNSRSVAINVTDDHAKVLLVDGEARWEYHYLASALQRDRTIELTRVVFQQPRLNPQLSAEELQAMGSPRQQLPAGPDALSDYDCIILGDVAEAQLPLAERKRLERYVADRGGTLVILAGKRSMPMGYPESESGGEADPLRKLLPVESPRVVAPVEGFQLTLTQEGKETKFLDIDPDLGKSAERWAQMPPHYWAVVGQAKEGATPLAYIPGPNGDARPLSERERQQALIVKHNYGFGRVLYVGLDSTWRWRYKVGDTYHHRFWGQAIRWAAADKPLEAGNEYLRFGTPQRDYHQGETVEIVTRLNENTGPVRPDLLAGARIVRESEKGDKDEAVALVPLSRRAAQPRVLDGQVRDLRPGKYAVELVIPDLADKLRAPNSGPAKAGGVLRAEFTVQPPDTTEMIDLETKWDLLQELAVTSGGKVYTPEDAAELVNRLANESVPHTEHYEQRLWQWWVLLALVVALLSVEWVGRKLAGLP